MGFIPPKEYRKILEKIAIPCVDLVIHVDGKFLLHKRTNQPAKGKWWVPGGRIYKGETNEKAALRKSLEETGMKVKIEKFIGVKETMFGKGPFGMGKVHTINIQYLVKPVSGKFHVKIDSQASEFKIFNKIEKSWDPYVKDIIKKSGILKK
jgi:colanic acid biosynthesis protein WcaH